MCRAYIKQAVILIVHSVIYDLRAVRRFRGWRTCFRSVSDWPRQSRWRKVRHVRGVMAREELRSFSRFMNLTLSLRATPLLATWRTTHSSRSGNVWALAVVSGEPFCIRSFYTAGPVAIVLVPGTGSDAFCWSASLRRYGRCNTRHENK